MESKTLRADAKYKIDSCTIPVRHIISQYNEGLIILDEQLLGLDYNEWELHRKQLYIKYLIEYGDNRFIQGNIFLLFNTEGEGTYKVTKDSFNSLKSIIQFSNNEFPIKIDYKEVYYKDLEKDISLLFNKAIVNFYNTEDEYTINYLTSIKTYLS